jgi:hypothetical protein
LALAAGRTGKTPPQTRAIASKPAPYHQGEALSAARFVRLHGLYSHFFWKGKVIPNHIIKIILIIIKKINIPRERIKRNK